jgi:hypothetical protein
MKKKDLCCSGARMAVTAPGTGSAALFFDDGRAAVSPGVKMTSTKRGWRAGTKTDSRISDPKNKRYDQVQGKGFSELCMPPWLTCQYKVPY